ncbi:MAG: lipid-binding SYLF domain-containing protein [Verrucomicrobiia bacterium]
MKTMILSLALLGFISAAFGADRAQLDDRIRALTAKFEALQAEPDKRVPAEVLRKAQGIILLDTTKAGFMFAFQGGHGVALVKNKWGHWSPAAFLTADEGSLGFQAGGEQNFYAILLMTTNTTHALLEPAMDFGAEAQGTAGNNSSRTESKIVPAFPSVRVYDDHNGFYAGAAIKGSALSPDDNANKVYYGQYESMSDILFDGKVERTESAAALAKEIKTCSEK